MQITDVALEACPPALSPEQISRFQNDGYLAFSDVLDKGELEAARRALSEVTVRFATGSQEDVELVPGRVGKSGIHGGAVYRSKRSRFTMQLEAGFHPEDALPEEIEIKVRKYMTFTDEHPALKDCVRAGNAVLRTVESLIGANPILFQEMALVKPPFIGSEKPWHQDNAYFSVTPLDSIVGVWIALDDAEIENGCMHVIPGGHRIGPIRHFHGSDCEIVEGRLDTSGAVPVPVPAGGAMFFYGLLPHETPPNRSPHRRRALQFHFRSASSQVLDREAYDKVFAESDGTAASCEAASRRGF